jgi:hypothetical protein
MAKDFNSVEGKDESPSEYMPQHSNESKNTNKFIDERSPFIKEKISGNLQNK